MGQMVELATRDELDVQHGDVGRDSREVVDRHFASRIPLTMPYMERQ